MATTLYMDSPLFRGHLTGDLPERPERLAAIRERLDSGGLLDRVQAHDPSPAEEDWLELVHDPAYLERFRQACRGGAAVLDSMDNPISARSEEVARLAAGGAIGLIDRLAAGEATLGFAALRPPGHHAGRAMARGFCFYNNVALAVRRAQSEHGIDRVLVIDFDVHHGNGTQEIFWEDGSVFYASLHQYPFYPGTGAADEIGAGDGEGRTLNLPLPAGCGDGEYREAFQEVVAASREFQPELVVVSAGFDAHRADPLGGMRLTEEGYAALTLDILDLSRGAPILSLLEGGYDLEALADSVATHLTTLLDS
jgi:acetoin utilization deacetylase AcuC-like enzyme